MWVEVILCKELYLAIVWADPFSDLCAGILTYEKIGKVLVTGVFNTRLGAYENVKVNDNVSCIGFDDLKDCTMSNYGRLLICMLNCTKLEDSQRYAFRFCWQMLWHVSQPGKHVMHPLWTHSEMAHCHWIQPTSPYNCRKRYIVVFWTYRKPLKLYQEVSFGNKW